MLAALVLSVIEGPADQKGFVGGREPFRLQEALRNTVSLLTTVAVSVTEGPADQRRN